MRRRLGLSLLAAVLVAIWAPSTAAGGRRAELLPCSVAARPPRTAPTGLPGHGAPVCRAKPTATQRASGLPRPAPGYHHLGATTATAWTGALGRLGVTDPGVRPGSYDFVATRFLAKRGAGGAVHWTEAGWTETGWSGEGRQRVYTFDSARDEWRFYDQYALRTGDRVWIYLEAADDGPPSDGGAAADGGPAADGEGVAWRSWLWWGTAWHLLAAERLPLDGGAQIEQYVEVYVDPTRAGAVSMPRVEVDNVQLRTPDGQLRYWRSDAVPTFPGSATGPYCLTWSVSYDTWSAGDC